MEIEEKIFYPRVRPEISDDDLMNEAEVEHDGAKDLIKQLGEELLAAKNQMRVAHGLEAVPA